MAVVRGYFRRQPGATGPVIALQRAILDFLWGTDRRRTITAVTAVTAVLGLYFLKFAAEPVKVAQLAVILAVFLGILLKPHIGVLALVFYVEFAASLGFDALVSTIGFTIVKSIGLFIVVSFLGIVVVQKRRPMLGDRTQVIFLYAFYLAILISSFASFNWGTAWNTIFTVLQGIVLYIVFYNLYQDEKWLSRYILVTVISVCIAVFTGLSVVAATGAERAGGALGNANGLAMVANAGLAMFLVLLLMSHGVRYRVIFLLGVVYCSTSIIFTGSRGGLLTAVITFAYQLLKKRRAILPYVAGLILLVVVFTLVPAKYKMRQEQWFETIISGHVNKATGGTRGFVYRAGLDMFRRSPIIGIGPRNFGLLYQRDYAYKVRGPASRILVVHSGILEILVENGILGFAAFTALVVWTFVLFRRTERICKRLGLGRLLTITEILEAAYVAALVAGAFETIIKVNIFYVTLCTAAVVNRLAHTAAQAAFTATPEGAAGPNDRLPASKPILPTSAAPVARPTRRLPPPGP